MVSTADSAPTETEATTPERADWWLYLLACTDGRTYTGVTLDVGARFRRHLLGKGAKFTRANPPLSVLGAQSFASKSAAFQAEYALKQLSKADKVLWATQWPYAQPSDRTALTARAHTVRPTPRR